ncbi:protein FAR1-RELATED SEQUENCE 5-like [Diospyros lotus]|uniref:protein FAR1-RELATED SEQUENCE 5-like n=1 Tax=Diospyros lotus TaxID=55363 RepID=UPI0022594D56|nr:protein FAR1-RELATED SEQUENCE 5-like [Diospyros lotus]
MVAGRRTTVVAEGEQRSWLEDEPGRLNGNEIFEIEDDELLGESDNVRIMDDVNTLDDELLGEDGPIVPKVGMKFKDENAVLGFYKSYAYDIGFPVRKRNSKKGDDGVVKLEVNDVAGIPLYKSFNSAVVEAGGNKQMTCVEKDCRNYIEKVRLLRLGEGDVVAIQAYFSRMQIQYPGFYFSIDLDEEARLKNVFWADNRCKEAYKEFGDVVTFDTTYLTNKYDMPFAPFVGMNHHGQSRLLGCGLVSNEDIEIWCLWHILKKLPEKFGNHVHKGSIHSAIHEVVYESQTLEEFEQGWASMINIYTLHEYEWLSGLYTERNRWVPCFLKTSFWAGMSTMQRSESMSAFFDGYVNLRTSLKQFVEQYERALKSQVEKEFHADFRSFSQIVPCASMYEMEKQLQSVYTISKFRECQEEFTGMMYCQVIYTDEGLMETTYDVQEVVMFDGWRKKKIFRVSFQREDCHIVCSCHLFEFKGILCRHAILILVRNDVTTLPEMYILRGWRKDVRRAHSRVAVNYDGWVKTPEQRRYDEMRKAFDKVADLIANSESRTQTVMEWIEFQLNDLSKTGTSYGSNLPSQQNVEVASGSAVQENTGSVNIQDPNCARRKGAPRKNRIKGALERTSKKSKVVSKTTKRTNLSQTASQEGPVIIQPSQQSNFTMITLLTFSQ